MVKTAVLVIDMQKAYFNNGSLEDEREVLTTHCNILIDAAQSANVPVFVIRTTHSHSTATWTLNMVDDKQGYLFAGEVDAEIVEGIHVDNTVEVVKTRDDAFFGTNLNVMLRSLGVEQLVLCGVSTHSCVMLTAASAYANNFRVVLANDAIASHDPAYHDSTLQMLVQEYRQQSMDTAMVVDTIL